MSIYIQGAKEVRSIFASVPKDLYDIELYGENRQKTYSGKQLADVNKTVTNYKIPNPLPAGTYTLSFKTTPSVGGGFRMSNSTNTSTNSVRKLGVANSKGYIVLTVTTDFVTNYINVSSDDSVANEIMLNEGSIALPYEPYVGGIASPNPSYPQDIESVEVREIKSIGKNLLAPYLLTNTLDGYIAITREFRVLCDSAKKPFFKTKFKENTTYAISALVYSEDYAYATFVAVYTDGTYESSSRTVVGEYTLCKLTTDSTKTLDYLGVMNWGGVTHFKDMQIEEGDVATPYEKFIEHRTTLSAPITLRGIGDVKDVLCKQDGVYGVLRKYGSIVLNGTEVWTAMSSNRVFTSAIASKMKKPTDNILSAIGFLCSHYTIAPRQTISDNKFAVESTGNVMFKDDVNATSLETWKAWLSANNMEIIYPLATPTFEPLSEADNEKLNNIKIYTHTSTDGEIVANIKQDKVWETKRIVSAWANKDGVATNVFEWIRGRFVAVGYKGAYYSKDSKTWSSMTGMASTFFAYGVTYGDGRYVCVGSDGKSYYSIDGKTWHEMTVVTGQSSTAMFGVAYGDGRFVAVGGNGESYYSTDGLTWNAMSGLSTSSTYHGVAYGGGRFVAVGHDGKFNYSLNGTTWTTITGTELTCDFERVAYGNGIFVAITSTSGNYSYYSTDGGSWHKMDGMPTECKDVTYGNGLFVAVGNGMAYYSSDGEVWRVSNDLANDYYYGVTYGSGRFVTVGTDGLSYYSKDGKKWVEMSGLSSGNFTDVCYSIDGGYDNS